MRIKLIFTILLAVFSHTQISSQDRNSGKLSDLTVKKDVITISYFPVNNRERYQNSMLILKKEIDLDLSNKIEKRSFILKDTISANNLKKKLLEDGCFLVIDSVGHSLGIVKISKGDIKINKTKVMFLK